MPGPIAAEPVDLKANELINVRRRRLWKIGRS